MPSNRLIFQLLELFITAVVSGLTTSAGLLALVHEHNWVDAVYIFTVPFLSVVGAGLRNLSKDNPSNG